MQENDSFEKGAPKNSSCSKEIAAPKEWLMCWSNHSKKLDNIASPKLGLSWKIR